MLKMKTTSSRCELSLVGARLAPQRTSLTTTVCGAWLNLRRALAKVQHPDPDLLPMPDSTEAEGNSDKSARAPQVPSRHFAETAAITPQLRADGVKKIVEVAQKHKLTTAGIFSSSESVEGIFNSRGLSDVAHANSGRSFYHHARRRFLWMAESELARRHQPRSTQPG